MLTNPSLIKILGGTCNLEEQNNSFGIKEYIKLQKRYNTARLLIAITGIFTLVNLALLIFNSDAYFFVSLQIPYQLTFLSAYYTDYYTAVSISLIYILFFMLCYLLSNNNKIWFYIGCAVYAIDFLSFLNIGKFTTVAILDLVFHIIVLCYLIIGVLASKKYFESKANLDICQANENVVSAEADNTEKLEEK